MSGCAVGIVNKTSTLLEQPFAVVMMRGNVTEATRCVGRYWQKEALDRGVMWNVNINSYQVEVAGPHLGGGAPPIGLVIDFEEIKGETVARAYCHRIFPENNPRRTVTLTALNACGLQSSKTNGIPSQKISNVNNIDYVQYSQKLVKGKTTKRDAERDLGKPTEQSYIGEYEYWAYYYRQPSPNSDSPVLHRLTLKYDNKGILYDYANVVVKQ